MSKTIRNVHMVRCLRFGSPAVMLVCVSVCLGQATGAELSPKDGAYHVYPGGSIQEALEAAARDDTVKIVRVHEGVYRPHSRRQALIWFNRRHDGITLEAVGEVVLTAQNKALADPRNTGYPAIVNHVVYMGDGISNKTVLRGFTLTGANNYVTDITAPEIEPSKAFRKEFFYLADGGAIKIWGRSYPTVENVKMVDNYTSPCGAAVSLEHHGRKDHAAIFRNCIFRNNRTQVAGSAVDLLPGSAIEVINCLFVENVSNVGLDYISLLHGSEVGRGFKNTGVVSAFTDTRATFERCTFTRNRNGVHDQSKGNIYKDCIFWDNTLGGGLYKEWRFEMHFADASGVTGCFVSRGQVFPPDGYSKELNTFNAPDPQFDEDYVPRAAEYENVGYRPR